MVLLISNKQNKKQKKFKIQNLHAAIIVNSIFVISYEVTAQFFLFKFKNQKTKKQKTTKIIYHLKIEL